jgi:hypothetical protein
MMLYLFFLSNEGILSATTMAVEFAQNCPKSPYFAQRQLSWEILEHHQKLRF